LDLLPSPQPNGLHQFQCAQSALLLGYAGLGGDREAIEPAGGVSPLRGGADLRRQMCLESRALVLSYRQSAVANYRS